MNSPRAFFLLPWVAVVLLSSPACISVPDIEPAKAEVHIASPDATAYTNGVLEVRLTVTGHAPERVELLRDGEVLTTLEAPYTYAWDTAGVAEGTYRLEARAVFGDVVFTSEAREVVVDRTPPQMVARTPEPGAQDVWVRSPIRAEFSEPMKASTVTDASVRLTVGEVEVARTVSLSADGKTLTVEPGAGYVPSNPASLTFAELVTDLAGNRVDTATSSWNWLVPYWVPWGTANGAPTRGHSDHIGSYTFDSSGTLIAVWHVTTQSSYVLYAKRWEGGEWKTQGQLLTSASDASQIRSESLLLDGNDNPIIAWSRRFGPDTSDISIKRWATDRWELLGGNLRTTPGLPQKTYLNLHSTPLGQPAIAWSESNTTETRICASLWNTSEWAPLGECFDAQATSDDYTNPVLDFTPNGSPVVSWMASQPTYHNINTSQLSNTDWTRLEGDRSNDIQGPYVSMGIDSTGTPIVVWPHDDGSGVILVVERWSGSEWQSMDGFIRPIVGSISPWSHSLQTDKSGAPFVAWTDSQIHVRRWNGTSWQFLDDISNTENDASTNSGSLQRLKSGELVLSWVRRDGSDYRMSVRRLNQ